MWLLVTVVLGITILAPPVFAQTCAETVQQYLNIVCGEHPTPSGTTQTKGITAEVEGHISGLARLIFGGEASIGGAYSEKAYSNYLQEDLPEVYAAVSNCRQAQFPMVVKRFCPAGAELPQAFPVPPPPAESDDYAALFLQSLQLVEAGNLHAAVNDLERLSNADEGRVRFEALVMASQLLTEIAENESDRGSLTRAHRDLDLAEPFLVQSDNAADRPIYLTVRAKAFLLTAWIDSPSQYATEVAASEAAATANEALELVSPGDPDGTWSRSKLTLGQALVTLGFARNDAADIAAGTGHVRGARAEYERQGNRGMVAEIDYHLQELCRRGYC